MRAENLSTHFAMIEILPRIYEPQRFLNSTKNTKNVSKCLRLKFDKNDNGHKSLMYIKVTLKSFLYLTIQNRV